MQRSAELRAPIPRYGSDSSSEAQNPHPNCPTIRLAILPGSLANHHSRSQIVVDTILPVNSSLLAPDPPHKNLLQEFPPLYPGQFSRTRAAQRQPTPERLVKPPREGIRIPPTNSQNTSPQGQLPAHHLDPCHALFHCLRQLHQNRQQRLRQPSAPHIVHPPYSQVQQTPLNPVQHLIPDPLPQCPRLQSCKVPARQRRIQKLC